MSSVGAWQVWRAFCVWGQHLCRPWVTQGHRRREPSQPWQLQGISLSLAEVLGPEGNSRELPPGALGKQSPCALGMCLGGCLVSPRPQGGHSWDSGPLPPVSLPSVAVAVAMGGQGPRAGGWDGPAALTGSVLPPTPNRRGPEGQHPHQVPALLPGRGGEGQLLGVWVPCTPHLLEP